MRFFSLLLVVLATLSACHPSELKRPPGYLNLGRLSDLQAPETYLPEKRVLVFRDNFGFSAMSTLCTYDLSPLVRQPDGSWVSEFSDSRYSPDGMATHGPARARLPRFALKAEAFQGESDASPVPYLFVNFAHEVSSDWRLR